MLALLSTEGTPYSVLFVSSLILARYSCVLFLSIPVSVFLFAFSPFIVRSIVSVIAVLILNPVLLWEGEEEWDGGGGWGRGRRRSRRRRSRRKRRRRWRRRRRRSRMSRRSRRRRRREEEKEEEE